MTVQFPKGVVLAILHNCNCTAAIDQYYQSIIHSLTMSANTCVPVKKSGYQKHWWSDELDELKQETIEATNFLRSVGCPSSGWHS